MQIARVGVTARQSPHIAALRLNIFNSTAFVNISTVVAEENMARITNTVPCQFLFFGLILNTKYNKLQKCLGHLKGEEGKSHRNGLLFVLYYSSVSLDCEKFAYISMNINHYCIIFHDYIFGN